MMYRFLLLMLCMPIYSLAASSSLSTADQKVLRQFVAPIESIDINHRQTRDLAAFGKAIGNARYIILGEKTHGEGNVFALKARLVRYLHENKGFNVLALESGMFDGAKINAMRGHGKPLRELAPDNLFFMYAGSGEFVSLFDYLDARATSTRPLQLATFDSQHSGGLSQQAMLLDLANYLDHRQSDLARSQPWREFAEHAGKLLRFERAAPAVDAQHRFFALLDQVDQLLASDPEQGSGLRDGAGFWRRISASLRAQALAFWLPSADPELNVPREQAMAENLHWLLQRQFPGQKVIIWTHDFHGQKKATYPGAKGALETLRENLPPSDFYHVYFTGYQGSYYDFNTGLPATVMPAHPDTIETTLHQAGIRRGFIDLKTAQSKIPKLGQLGVGDYEGHFSHNNPKLSDFIDGVFYLDAITPASKH